MYLNKNEIKKEKNKTKQSKTIKRKGIFLGKS